MKFRSKVAVVTGGASGIGRAIAQRLAEEGLTVVIADRRLDDAQAACTALGGKSFAVELDVTSQESISAATERVVGRAGRIDVLVNSAGQFDLLPFLEVTPESYERVFSVNVSGLLFMMQAAAKRMIAQGDGGKIINLASQAGRRGEPLVSVYCASKAAVISLTQSAGLALIKHGINVNAIAPGVIDTPMYDFVDSLCAKYMNIPIGENKRQVSQAVPFGRMGKPEEIASLAAFLASDDADYIVAQTYGVDGGNWMA
ncbi:L-iditol 2-dehydrogenase [Acidisoma cellulosilytica]|uniref:L-iditol 2-dehydrogenase n=1 Tax=Acidisoma cellulosilyticum TaxID=2802395 RepID=A0A964E5C5_9PROT|nr:L-iditol 2-dehydrogenase [Acidisoma cellulosilyticum]MCB8882272.1 L-iditol 2-dehydrogenase [Acidisoma cellulosilyticum]